MSDVDWVIDFLNRSPSSFHFIANAKKALEEKGFVELKENENWNQIPQKFFVSRKGRCLMAMNTVNKSGGTIIACHCDFSCFEVQNRKVQLYDSPTFETYPGHTFKMAGRVLLNRNGKREIVLYDSQKPLFIYNRSNFRYRDVINILKQDLNVNEEDIIEMEMGFLSDEYIETVGVKQDLINGEKFDDQLCSATSLYGFLHSEPTDGFSCYCVFDNEEIGSNTFCGAQSSLISDILYRVGVSSSGISNTLLLSCDAAHAFSPVNPSLFDEKDRVIIGKGVGFVDLPSGQFASDKITLARFQLIAKNANLPIQKFTFLNRQPTGSTIGKFITTRIGAHCIEMGIPVLSMHALKETASKTDIHTYNLLVQELIKKYLEMTK